jgi:hypothetical protein
VARFDKEAATVNEKIARVDKRVADGLALVFLLALCFEVVASLACHLMGFGLAMAAALPLPFLVCLSYGSLSLFLLLLPLYSSLDVLLFSSC